MINFVPSQIVSLDCKNKSLYCEVIDVIQVRSIGWLRPVILVNQENENTDYFRRHKNICDLRFTSDLFWKLEDLRIVLDTEYIAFLGELNDFEFDENKLTLAKQQLRLFIEEKLDK